MAAFGVLLLALLFLLVFTSLSGRKVVWLTPAQLARRAQPGPFTTFKQKVKNLTSPLWRRLRRAPSQITINSTVLKCSPTAEPIALGTPITTNANGIRAWILTSMESSTLHKQLRTDSGAALLDSPGIMTLNGGQARVVVNSAPTVNLPGTSVTIDLIPKVVASSIKLTIAATSVETTGPPGSAQSVTTNFTAACQAVIPNGGSLVLDGGTRKDPGGSRYWLIISPTVWTPVNRQTH